LHKDVSQSSACRHQQETAGLREVTSRFSSCSSRLLDLNSSARQRSDHKHTPALAHPMRQHNKIRKHPSTVLVSLCGTNPACKLMNLEDPMRNGAARSPEAHLTMQVVNHIRAMLESGTLKPGDKIPPEREFANKLKISRASLRTGIGYLAAIGVMKVRHGVGTFVADGPPEIGKSSIKFMGALHAFQPWQMFEARLLLESG